jgi:hypothetical protein
MVGHGNVLLGCETSRALGEKVKLRDSIAQGNAVGAAGKDNLVSCLGEREAR